MTTLEAMERILNLTIEYMKIIRRAEESIPIVQNFLDEYGQVAPTTDEWASVPTEYRWFAIDGYQGSEKCSAGFSIDKPYFDIVANVWWSEAGDAATYIEAAPRELPDGVMPHLCLWQRHPSEDAQ